MTTETHEGYVVKAWPYTTDDDRNITCFTLDGFTGAFWGDETWLPLLTEAIELKTWCRVVAENLDLLAPRVCSDPLCGDGCCDNPDCTNVPEDERQRPFLVRANTIEWL